MPRFVLLAHDHPHPHIDLMLEVDAVLWTWQLPAFPGDGVCGEARRIFDHRPVYLDYEGPVSGGRGLVRRLDRGSYDWLVQAPGRLEAQLSSERLSGRLELVQVEGERWQVSYWSEAGAGRSRA
jgi:hypothetical protein